MARKTHAEVIASFVQNKSAFLYLITPNNGDKQRNVAVIAISASAAKTAVEKQFPDAVTTLININQILYV